MCMNHAHNLPLPRHWWHVGAVVHAAPELAMHHQHRTLLLGNDLHDAAALALPLHAPPASSSAVHAALEQALAEAASSGARRVIVELPGLRDAEGRSPFWQGLCRHFYGLEPALAEERFGPAWRSHVGALLPRQLVYTAFLPAAAQQAIGQADPTRAAWQAALHQAGFRWREHVAVHDAGPVLELELDAAVPAPQR
jgi:arginine/ornithine succinyltransferase subunit-like protein